MEPIDESISSLASSMYLFTELRLADTKDACIKKVYASVILQILSQFPNDKKIDVETLRKSLAEKTFSSAKIDPAALQAALDSLYSLGFISLIAEPLTIALTSRGKEAIAKIRAERSLIQERFEQVCNLFLKQEYPNIVEQEAKNVINTLRIGLVRAFEKRGMEIGRSVFSDDTIDISDATDLLEVINKESSILSNHEQRSAFADLLIEVLLRPSGETKDYLAALAHGYFAYHALGLEPRCSKERLQIAKEKKWIFDSSILLPVIAVDCVNHLYAKDLLATMQALGFSCYTTEALFDEVREHAWWAIKNFSEIPPSDMRYLQAVTARPGFKQNLFLDGATKRSLTQGVPSLTEYMSECLGANFRKNLGASIRDKIVEQGIKVVSFSEWPGFYQDLWFERDELAAKIEQIRRAYGTYRGENQCVAEAEVVLIAKLNKAAFLSQSGILNKLNGKRAKITWIPEAMYRFLSLFSSVPVEPRLLYDSMTQSFYYAGFDIIDKDMISKFIPPLVRQARMQLDREKTRYEQVLGKKQFSELREEFDRIPDEQKPFYSMQFAFYIADREICNREAAEARARQAATTKRLTDKERDELTRLRAEKEVKRKKELKKRRKHRSQRKHKR